MKTKEESKKEEEEKKFQSKRMTRQKTAKESIRSKTCVAFAPTSHCVIGLVKSSPSAQLKNKENVKQRHTFA